ncbi:hypothetical protein K457DRAFT_772302 [Linnemannia elongata AG-77]|uniref:Uncharacterized protein n=1 Tax=Linnemannia elongata AG-77 TaxID=1314771 RepID=A0A197KDN5_9FUNG|nr:hypothetical protein K457DRAFT_772302 [Linnemannia elongata AG-77]
MDLTLTLKGPSPLPSLQTTSTSMRVSSRLPSVATSTAAASVYWTSMISFNTMKNATSASRKTTRTLSKTTPSSLMRTAGAIPTRRLQVHHQPPPQGLISTALSSQNLAPQSTTSISPSLITILHIYLLHGPILP